ncbi:hypothetical protein AB0L22_24255 [Micromonospora haikouensis]
MRRCSSCRRLLTYPRSTGPHLIPGFSAERVAAHTQWRIVGGC